MKRRRPQAKQVKHTHQSLDHVAPTHGGRVCFLADNLSGRGSSFLGNAKPRGFHNELVAALHRSSQSNL
jgi:hypothetical protein